MSDFTSSTPELDLTLQNLANSTTVIQAMAYSQQVNHDPDGTNFTGKRWRKICDIAVILRDNQIVIPPQEYIKLANNLVG